MQEEVLWDAGDTRKPKLGEVTERPPKVHEAMLPFSPGPSCPAIQLLCSSFLTLTSARGSLGAAGLCLPGHSACVFCSYGAQCTPWLLVPGCQVHGDSELTTVGLVIVPGSLLALYLQF